MGWGQKTCCWKMSPLSQADQQEGAKGVGKADASGKLNRLPPAYLERLTRTVYALALKNCSEQQTGTKAETQ